jgi:hypothetical protein
MLVFTSIPKSGTHLVRSVLEQLLGPPGQSLTKHAPWRPRGPWTFGAHLRYQGQRLARNARVLVLVRDPRAIVLSMRDFVVTGRGGGSVHPSLLGALAPLPFHEQVRRIAAGVRTEHGRIAPIDRHCSGFLEWPDATVLKFEDLFTSAGGAVLHACLPRIPIPRIQAAIDAAIGADTPTLNVGDPDRWRSRLDLETIRLIEDRAGDAMHQLGYRRLDIGPAPDDRPGPWVSSWDTPWSSLPWILPDRQLGG